MRYLISLIYLCCVSLATAQDWEEQATFEGTGNGPTLRILSSTDVSVFAPVIDSFQDSYPNVHIEYLVTGTADLDRQFRNSPQHYDVVISSAMDLQLKLANDGFALRLNDIQHDSWAQWRNSVFAFTAEPAAIVINQNALQGNPPPRTRQDLIDMLRANPDLFRGKVATYDVRSSGLGYLFATQDARASETYWRLTEVMGSLNARLYCCSGEMLDDLISGKILVAYNVLGSYALAREGLDDQISIILPSAFPTMMMRTALASKQTDRPAIAEAFIHHLTQLRFSGLSDQHFPLPHLPDSRVSDGHAVIPLEPALITYLDTLKRRTFIREWESAIIHTP
ncbi:MAG: ABC transporter substrate-binding protein [Halocynthiibacter sp.]